METFQLTIGTLIFLCVFMIMMFLFLKHKFENNESEFVINHNILIKTIEFYKEMILSQKINTLKSNFDLNEKSKTNSLAAFSKAENEIISAAIKEIISVYLSDSCRAILMTKYGHDGLCLMILTFLKRS